MAEATKRYAVVTGANKGIGLEICRQLASKGIVVILTARDEKRGIEAVQELKDSGIPDDLLIFYQLDVSNPVTISPLPEFVKTRFGKLDILVNNAGILGTEVDEDALIATGLSIKDVMERNWNEALTQTYELAEACLRTNYYGAKRMTEALMPFLQLSNSPRIVNVSSQMGNLEKVTNKWAKRILSDAEKLTEERIDEVLSTYLKDFKDGSVEAKGWPSFMSAYTLSKAALNAYTRVMAKKYQSFCINCVCPGFVKTDINFHMGVISVAEGASAPLKLAMLPDGGPSGCFFAQENNRFDQKEY